MSRKSKKYLVDIQAAIQRIEENHLHGVNEAKEFVEDSTAQRAVERELITIGEAIRRLRQMGIIFPQTDRMINRRNTIIHQYDVFNPANIWQVVKSELPSLEGEVKKKLTEKNE